MIKMQLHSYIILTLKYIIRFVFKIKIFELNSEALCLAKHWELVKGFLISHKRTMFWIIIPSDEFRILCFVFKQSCIVSLCVGFYHSLDLKIYRANYLFISAKLAFMVVKFP